MLEFTGVIGFIIFILDLIAIYNIVTSNESTLAKIGWSLLVFFLPVLGLIIWAIAGPRGGHAVSA